MYDVIFSWNKGPGSRQHAYPASVSTWYTARCREGFGCFGLVKWEIRRNFNWQIMAKYLVKIAFNSCLSIDDKPFVASLGRIRYRYLIFKYLIIYVYFIADSIFWHNIFYISVGPIDNSTSSTIKTMKLNHTVKIETMFISESMADFIQKS